MKKGGRFYLSKANIFFGSCLAFIFAVGIASYLPRALARAEIFLFAGLVILIVVAILTGKKKRMRIIVLWGLFFIFGFWRFSQTIFIPVPSDLAFYNGNIKTLTGVISAEPERKEKVQKFIISVDSMDKNQPVTGKLLVFTKPYPQYDYGEAISLVCELNTPEPIEGFAYDRYLAKDKIYSVCYYPRGVKIKASEQENAVVAAMLKIKDKARKEIDRGLAGQEAEIIKAMILGDKTGIDSGLREVFAGAGISHIIAISGLHMGIITGLLIFILLYFGISRRYLHVFVIFLLAGYVLMIGAPASAVRSAIMCSMVLWALSHGRSGSLVRILLYVAWLMLLINPRLLRDDIGFQLSFLAVLGIATVMPFINSIFSETSTKLKNIALLLFVSLAAQIFTLPLVALQFGIVSFVSPISNLLIIWILPFVMIFTILAIFFTFLLPTWSTFLFLPVKFTVNYIMLIAEKAFNAPFAYAKIDYFPLIIFFFYYLFLIFIWLKIKFKLARNL